MKKNKEVINNMEKELKKIEKKNLWELRDKLQSLITITNRHKDKLVKRIQFLLATMSRLNEIDLYQDNENKELLRAYLTIKGHQYSTEFNTFDFMEKIVSEVDEIIKEMEQEGLIKTNESDTDDKNESIAEAFGGEVKDLDKI